MTQVEFTYNGEKTIIQCNLNEKMEDIIQRFAVKTQIQLQNVYFLYSGKFLIENSTFEQTANEEDKKRKLMSIIVNDKQGEKVEASLKKSKYIICPTCGENIHISIKKLKVCLYECKNGHKLDDISFKNFEDTQYIDESKIKCDECGKNKSQTYQNKLYTCLNCKSNLCPLCQSSHDKSHYIIDYSQKNFICKIHNDIYNNYCEDCKKDICTSCEDEHKGHKIVSYGKILPKKDELLQDLDDSKKVIIKFKEDINEIISKLNAIILYIDNYYNIYNELINNFNIREKNYIILQNVNDMKLFNENFIKSIDKIINDKSIKSKFNNIIEIPNKIDLKEKEEDNNIIEYNPSIENDFNRISGQNFCLGKLKELKSIKTEYKISKVIVLNDGRILIQNEIDKNITKLCVYNIYKDIICDITYDFYYPIIDILQMDDNNLIITSEKGIEIFKITEKNLEKLQIYEGKYSKIYKLSEKEIFTNRDYSTNEFPVFIYENNELKKNGEFVIKFKFYRALSVINKNEFAIYHWREGRIYGDNAFITFYDTKSRKETFTINLGNFSNGWQMILGDENNIIVEFNKNLLVINVNNKKIITKYEIKELKVDDVLDCGPIIALSESSFIVGLRFEIILFDFYFKDKIKIYDKKCSRNEDQCYKMVKYPGNKLIITENGNTLVIYGIK